MRCEVNKSGLKIGVLALQGGFAEHLILLKQLGARTATVRNADQLADLDGLILPGGESTTFSKYFSIDQALYHGIISAAQEGLAIWGTCAGAILLSARGQDGRVPVSRLGLLDATINRNAYGRQAESFIEMINAPVLEGGPFPGVFVRAPRLEGVPEGCEVVAQRADGEIVGLRKGRLLLTTFHPELTEDLRFHHYFLYQVC